jgi:hypothetical protein
MILTDCPPFLREQTVKIMAGRCPSANPPAADWTGTAARSLSARS